MNSDTDEAIRALGRAVAGAEGVPEESVEIRVHTPFEAAPIQDPDCFDHAMFPEDENFEIALTIWRESANLAALTLGKADDDENVRLLNSEEKSAERRKAEAKYFTSTTRTEARLAAIVAEAVKLRVLYLVNKARPVAP